ncbi:1-deoxy-D-xylulose-5-phosphate reductoisomerase [Hydrogeniiclostridium mannosilyticum]|uniref:1-deoxy-D-xylulose 5-phosphate reductoisomerase n=1 Tax=Hydrogeniiclostridium mannosilyticum TaxID=2764322 RepID=A0A328UA61_9FIRM|nr:1-deoxy-D-xylulose-5-phosphate reductoisomerase [Hydrogeniiclostridium mannosilyticum]RAQ28400.1 1-deoxy-D-xylulose-5-phosphate reductoisomerase [Hydrogeniiclostridium mannosilyticum]
MKHCLTILGSTGSIGTQTLDVVRKLGLSVCALAANRNISLLENQIREFKPQLVAVFDLDAAKQLRIAVADTKTRVVQGKEGVLEAASYAASDLVCNALVGLAGLEPTLAAIHACKDIALANKETLVAGGALVKKEARKQGVTVYPVDSEHSAIFQCLQGCRRTQEVRRLLLTASGGPFFGKKRGELTCVTPEQALRHPNWSMGAKVTIDSATMMNKGLEIIEASWLFDVPADRIDVLVHRESIVHSMVEYADFSVIAQLGVPDMRIPIQYAVTYPEREPSPVEQLDLIRCGSLSFCAPDEETFVCLRAAKTALKRGGLAPTVLNGANEAAVPLFLQGKISFLEIGDLVAQAVAGEKEDSKPVTLENILEADARARRFVLEAI